jgi:hypothetical protein
MTSFVLTQTQAVTASGPGALDGFECKCSCGMTLRSSLRTLLEQDATQHVAYHERKEARG